MSSREDYFEDKNDYKYVPNEYEDDNDYDYDNRSILIFDNYNELMIVSQHTKTDNKLSDILYGLMNVAKMIKKKEVSFTYDYTIAPNDEWLKIAKDFNSNVVGKDYTILIDETAIVCYVKNNDLLK